MGGELSFPGLGFDPVPGDPVALGTAGARLRESARTLTASGDALAETRSSAWSGPAADAFRARLADLPRDLGTAGTAYERAGRALQDFSSVVGELRRRVPALEARAVEARARLRSAGLQADARARYAAAGADLEAVLAEARGVRATWVGAGDALIRSLGTAASSAPYREPPWYERAWDATTRWVKDHAEVLNLISTALGVIAGVLAVVPGLNVLSLVLGGVALGMLVGLKLLTGEGSWAAITAEAALTFVPGGRLLSSVRAGKGIRALDEGGEALAAVNKAPAYPKTNTNPGTHLDDPLFAAANRDVDLNRIDPKDYVLRTNNRPIIRHDPRNPDDIFVPGGGFHPKDVNGDYDLNRLVSEANPGPYVSSSYADEVTEGISGEWRYTIEAPGGIDLPASPSVLNNPFESEVAWPGGISERFVRDAEWWTMSPIGEDVPSGILKINPHFEDWRTTRG